MLQFYFTQDIFGSIGLKPSAESKPLKQKQQLKIHHQMLFVTVLLPFNFLCFTVFFWAAFEQAGGSMTILQKNIHKENCLE
jgi:POT family proton-dependent oligopeptide transporter